MTPPNKITGANAGGLRPLPILAQRAARIAQFRRSEDWIVWPSAFGSVVQRMWPFDIVGAFSFCCRTPRAILPIGWPHKVLL